MSRSALILSARLLLATSLLGGSLAPARADRLTPAAPRAGDRGILLELDRETFELTARDLRDEAAGPHLRVVLGSPAHPTPAGSFRVYQVIRSPEWQPGEQARAAGAEPVEASTAGPMGIAKIPFAAGGFALHGGAHPLLLGKPVSLGCVRAADEDLAWLLDWLQRRGALGRRQPRDNGEAQQSFLRPARIVVR